MESRNELSMNEFLYIVLFKFFAIVIALSIIYVTYFADNCNLYFYNTISLFVAALISIYTSSEIEKTKKQLPRKILKRQSSVIVCMFFIGLLFLHSSYVLYMTDEHEIMTSFVKMFGKEKSGVLYAFIFIGICQPFVEEWFFRNKLLKTCFQHGFYTSFVATTLTFAVMHGSERIIHPILLGGLCYILTVGTGSIFFPIVLHSINNISVLTLCLLDDLMNINCHLVMLFGGISLLLMPILLLLISSKTKKELKEFFNVYYRIKENDVVNLKGFVFSPWSWIFVLLALSFKM